MFNTHTDTHTHIYIYIYIYNTYNYYIYIYNFFICFSSRVGFVFFLFLFSHRPSHGRQMIAWQTWAPWVLEAIVAFVVMPREASEPLLQRGARGALPFRAHLVRKMSILSIFSMHFTIGMSLYGYRYKGGNMPVTICIQTMLPPFEPSWHDLQFGAVLRAQISCFVTWPLQDKFFALPSKYMSNLLKTGNEIAWTCQCRLATSIAISRWQVAQQWLSYPSLAAYSTFGQTSSAWEPWALAIDFGLVARRIIE